MDFFQRLYADCEHPTELRGLKNGRVSLRQWLSCDEIMPWAEQHRDCDLYFGVATRNRGKGGKTDLCEIPALWCDIDFKKTDQSQIKAALSRFPFRPTFAIESGGGYHLYWKLREPATYDEVPEVEIRLRKIAFALDGDMACTDASRILRIPGSLNYKYTPPRRVSIAKENSWEFNLADFDDLADPPYEQNRTAAAPVGELGVARCLFIHHCIKDAATLPEPEWHAMISCLCREKGGIDLIHEASRPYPKYNRDETDRKILQAVNSSGPVSCDYIRTLWNCGTDCGIKSPASLKITGQTGQTGQTGHYRTLPDSTGQSPDTYRTVTGHLPDTPDSQAQKFNGTLTAEIREYVKKLVGSFTTADIDREFGLTLRRDKKTRSDALGTLVHKNIIKKDINIAGRYYVPDTNVNWISIQKGEESNFDLNMPFSLSKLVGIPPKGIILIAGETNTGKTALGLQIIGMNIDKPYDRLYLCSEMGESEYGRRVKKLYPDIDFWEKQVKAAERTTNFGDVISSLNPDGLNVVDYLAMGAEPWRVGEKIEAINEALGKGVAVILIQKKTGSAFGQGGEPTLFRPRLSVNVSALVVRRDLLICSAKITKAKEYFEFNPTNREKHFVIERGVITEEKTKWRLIDDRERANMINYYKTQYPDEENEEY